MKTCITIFYKTNKTFDYLDNQYFVKLDKICNLIFIIVGAVQGVESSLRHMHSFVGFYNNTGATLFVIISALLGASTFVITGRYIITYLFYGIGRLLKGSKEVVDIRTVIAYSAIPLLLKLPVFLYLSITGHFNNVTGYEYWFVNVSYTIIWIFMIKITVQGIMKFNDFGMVKALVNVSPLILLGVFSMSGFLYMILEMLIPVL